MTNPDIRRLDVPRRIRDSGLTIYDPLSEGHELYLTAAELQAALMAGLKGLDLNYPLRTRSKVLKGAACRALGYPVPLSFQQTNPRFPGQDFDTYVQKSNNLQIWNEELAPSRRYALIRVDASSRVTNVRVVTGEVLAGLDPTGTLTQKFQAKSRTPIAGSVLVSKSDTASLRRRFALDDASITLTFPKSGPADAPGPGDLLPIDVLFKRLKRILGETITNPGADQERNRGAALHRAVCSALGYRTYRDRGQFPDVANQLLEVKLQTATTVDLGLVTPDSSGAIAGIPGVKHRDVRYALFYGTLLKEGVRIDHLVLATGKDFFRSFQRFEGLILNRKLQIPLPVDFFNETE